MRKSKTVNYLKKRDSDKAMRDLCKHYEELPEKSKAHLQAILDAYYAAEAAQAVNATE